MNDKRVTLTTSSLFLAMLLVAVPSQGEDYTVTRFAGKLGGTGHRDATGIEARFSNPSALAAAADGTIYVADSRTHTIRKISPSGVTSTVAGVAGDPGLLDGRGSAARFDSPSGIVVDASGQIYVADLRNRAIRKISPEGVVSTFAVLDSIFFDVDVDLLGNVYAATLGSISKFTPAGVRSTLPSGASFVTGIAVNDVGDIFLACSLEIRKVTQSGASSVFVNQFVFATKVSFDAAGNLLTAGRGLIHRVTPSGVVTAVAPTLPFNTGDVVAAPGGDLFLASGGLASVLRLTAEGVFSTIAGPEPVIAPTSGDLTTATFVAPYDAVFDSLGNLFVSDLRTIRKITPDGQVILFAGDPDIYGPPSRDGVGTDARFENLLGIIIDDDDNLYVGDGAYNRVRKITPGAVVTTLPNLFSSWPRALVRDGDGNLFVVDSDWHYILKLTPSGEFSSFAGNGTAGSTDGTGFAASFNKPSGIEIDSAGNLFVSDAGSRTIRKITPLGEVTTLAGNPSALADLVDGTGANARFVNPSELAIDSTGLLWLADAGTLRTITPDGVVTTIIGRPGLKPMSMGRARTPGFSARRG